ncbi:hypothetical protein GGS26DRAFT_180332 [Hypomontagnella submonticulosa]|nr:hypothetical protein GGS26DRAFT_180332 [Hypomontagnella submonticulosa]
MASSEKSKYESLRQDSFTPEVTPYGGAHSGFFPSDSKSTQASFGQHPLPEQIPEEISKTRRHHVFRFWPWEIGSVVVSFGLIAATFSILSHYNEQKVPEWPFSINLNTLVALISTIMRAAMLVGVAEVISQTKWTWFSRPRPLSHLQYFDAASRSVSGSLSLLFVAPGSTLGVIGALVTILSLGMGPFAQQAIKTVSCRQTHTEVNATLPVAHFVPGYGSYYRVGAGLWEVEIDMKGTMVNGIADPTSKDLGVVATCPTGNCTFTRHNGITHSSIGLCSACIDTSSFITMNKTAYPNSNYTLDNYTLPNGMWVSPNSDYAYLNVATGMLSWAKSIFDPEFAKLNNASILSTTVLALSTSMCPGDEDNPNCPIPDGYGGPTGYVATSCSLYPCLKNYDATMEKGVLSEKIVSSQPATVNWVEAGISPGQINSVMNWTALQTPCLLDGTWYDLPNLSSVPKIDGRTFTDINIDGTNYTAPHECLYKISYPFVAGLTQFANSNLLSGTCTYNRRQGEAISCYDNWWLARLYNGKKATFESIRTAFDQFATAVTNKLRTTGSSNTDILSHETVQGQVIEMTVCTEFQWRWLLMPTILVAITAAILIAIIIQNLRDHKQPVWKSSLLPLLYYGFGETHHQDPRTPVMDLTQMNRAASDTRAKFRNGAGAGFVDVTPTVSGIDLMMRKRGRDVDVDSLIEGR